MKLERSSRFDIVPVAPFDFDLTMRKPAGWSLFNSGEVYEKGTLWTATRFEGRLVGLKFRSIGSTEEPRVETTLFTRAAVPEVERAELEKALHVLIGADQDLAEFYAMAKEDGILRHVVEDLYGMHDTQTAYLFNSVVLSICLQMARMERSMKMMGALTRRYGDRVELDGRAIVVEPSAETLAKVRPAELSKECNLGYRAKYIVGCAKMVAKGFPGTMEVLRMPPEEGKKRLMEFPGVGDYAADIINPHGGFPIDAWSVDVFGKLFFGEEPDDAREAIEEVKEEGTRRWGKLAWLAFFYVAQDLEGISRRLGVKLRLH